MRRLTFLAVAITMCTGMMLAQPPQGGRRGPRDAAGGPPSGNPPTVADMVARRVEMLTNFLSLTDSQQAEAATIFTAAANAAQPLQSQMQTAQTALGTAVKNNATGDIDVAATQIGQLQGQITSINSRAEAKLYALLTADQKAKYDTRPPGGFGGPGGRGFGGPPPPRPN